MTDPSLEISGKDDQFENVESSRRVETSSPVIESGGEFQGVWRRYELTASIFVVKENGPRSEELNSYLDVDGLDSEAPSSSSTGSTSFYRSGRGFFHGAETENPWTRATSSPPLTYDDLKAYQETSVSNAAEKLFSPDHLVAHIKYVRKFLLSEPVTLSRLLHGDCFARHV